LRFYVVITMSSVVGYLRDNNYRICNVYLFLMPNKEIEQKVK
jgi:hypothetical protein